MGRRICISCFQANADSSFAGLRTACWLLRMTTLRRFSQPVKPGATIRRLNRDLRNIPRMPELLGSILTRTEIAALGLAQAQGRCPFTWRRDAGCGAQWFRAGGRPLGQFPGAQLTVCRLAGRWPLRVRRTRPECILACRLAIMNALCDSVRSDPLLKNL